MTGSEPPVGGTPRRRVWLALAAVALLLLASPAGGAPRGFSIERFAVGLAVQPDGSLTVQETLTFSFRGEHRGIFRTIPIRYVRHGLEYALRIDDVHVLDEAHQPLRSEVAYPGRAVKIKAWVPGAVDATRTVRILYRVRRAVLHFDDHDELYWNVTGDEWDVRIAAAEAAVALPAAVDAGLVQAIAYTGPRGAAGRDWEAEPRRDSFTFRTTRPLAPREGLTIVLGWPPGAVDRASALREASWLAEDNWPLGLPLVVLALIGLVWRAYGRDPVLGRSIKPEYEAPRGMIPAEAGTLIDEHAEPRDVVATLVDLAVRGDIHIERPDGNDFVFHRLSPLADDPRLKPLERTLLQKIFGEDLSLRERRLSEMRRDYDYVFVPIRDAIYRTMVEDGLFPRSPFWIRQGWAALGALLFTVAGVLWVQGDRFGPLGWSLPGGVAASALVVLGFSRVMPRRTWRGAQLLVHLKGFEEFLERAEKDRLERMPSDTLHRMLPWAIALGVTERWIHNFQGLTVAPPAWYTGTEPFELSRYGRDVTTFGRQAEEAILTTRRTSGAGGWTGGGGSSGGGFGGGGGGTF